MATVQITIKNDAGTVLDESLTTMPQAVLDTAIAALAAAYNYKSTIDNPDFKANEPESDTNSKTIPNPMTPVRHMTVQWRLFTEDHARAYGRKQAEAAVAAALQSVDHQISQVVVE